jgi:hypothetical protein
VREKEDMAVLHITEAELARDDDEFGRDLEEAIKGYGGYTCSNC